MKIWNARTALIEGRGVKPAPGLINSSLRNRKRTHLISIYVSIVVKNCFANDIESSKQKEVKPNDDRSAHVNKQDDDESDNQADNKLKEYGDNISEFSDFNTEEQGHVRLEIKAFVI
uniref:Uncharacterized protein n=1 Tax=Strongyloides venezuelensis TaxID=75913 RepID=A0A0K0FBA3_STRVS